MRQSATVAYVAFVMTLVGAVPAEAQLIPGRPFRALFRTTNDPAMSRDRIDFTLFVAGGHDEGELRDGRGALASDPRLSAASFGSLVARGVYAHEARRSRFTLTGGGTTRYYSAVNGLSPMNLFAAAQWTTPVGRRTSATLGQRVQYSPYATFRPGADDVATDEEATVSGPVEEPMADVDDPTDHRMTRRTTYSYNSDARLNSRTGRNSRVEMRYTFRFVDAASEASDFVSHRPSARYTHSLGRHAALSLGYALSAAEYIDLPFGQLVRHDINGGLIYGRQLPFSRQTRISFATRTSLVADEGSSRLHIGGVASLAHQFTRDWRGSLSYRRSTEVLEGFAVPFFTSVDGVTASVGGRVAGPLRVMASGGYARGSFSVQSLDNGFQSRTASVRLWLPLAWMLAPYVEGYYSQYDFERRLGLLPTTSALSTRYGVRAGLTFWVPVLR